MLALLKSLDVMREIQRLNYENHPTVSKKPVKFLAVNMEFQSIKDLQTAVAGVQTDVSLIKKEITNLKKGHQTLSNKVDQVKADRSALIERVQALENHEVKRKLVRINPFHASSKFYKRIL